MNIIKYSAYNRTLLNVDEGFSWNAQDFEKFFTTKCSKIDKDTSVYIMDYFSKEQNLHKQQIIKIKKENSEVTWDH